MDKYLLDILKEMNTIIIPGLGALTITNSASGEIMFMPYLKYDDGKLARYIAEKEGWSENDAHNLIAKYVREIEAKLNTGESYDMYRFGSFSKNASGEIEFNKWKEGSVSVEENDYIEPPLGDEEIEDTTSENIIPAESTKTIEEEPNPEHSEFEHIEEVKESSEEKEEVIVVEEAQVTEYVADPVVPETKFQLYTEEDQWNDDLDLPPINAKVERPKKPILEKTKSDKKNRRPVLIVSLIVGVLLIGGTLTGAMFYNSLSKVGQEEIAENKSENTAEPKKQSSSEESPVTEAEETKPITDQEEIEEPSTETADNTNETVQGMIQTSTGQVDPSRPYHLIAGAFSVKENAERYRDRLRESGNSNAEIIGEFDGLFMVSAASYSSNDEALSARRENSTFSRSWVFHWP